MTGWLEPEDPEDGSLIPVYEPSEPLTSSNVTPIVVSVLVCLLFLYGVVAFFYAQCWRRRVPAKTGEMKEPVWIESHLAKGTTLSSLKWSEIQPISAVEKPPSSLTSANASFDSSQSLVSRLVQLLFSLRLFRRLTDVEKNTGEGGNESSSDNPLHVAVILAMPCARTEAAPAELYLGITEVPYKKAA